MASLAAIFYQATNRAAFALKPVTAQWNALASGARRLVVIGAVLLGAGFVVAFVWLPAVRTRDALTVRLPQLEVLLAGMRSQAEEVKALAKGPAMPITPRTAADVAALQSIFGREAQVTAADGGFRIVIPAVAYANWWDQTGEALSRHGLVLRAASVTRSGGPNNAGAVVAVDMRLGGDARAAGSTANPASTRPGK